MDLIKVFQENQVRIIGTNDSPLFVASDIAKILDIKNINDAISDFEEYEKMGIAIPDPHGRQQITNVLTEAGLYSLVMKSRKPIAKEFKKWVMSEVLPSIRREGKYELEKTMIKQKQEAEQKIKEVETKYKQLDTFMKRKHFTARDVIYLAQMHPSRADDIYKFGRTTDETTRRKNYRGQRAEPIEILETIPVIDRKRAEGNLKYIVEPYIYSNTSEEIVQMPYHLLKLAADAAVYIDKIKLRISEEMKNYIPPHIETSTIEPATDNEITAADSEVKDLTLSVSEEFIIDEKHDNIAEELDEHTEINNIAEEKPDDIPNNKIQQFIDKYLRKKDKAKVTRVKLQEIIKREFKDEVTIDNLVITSKLTDITQEILETLNIDKKATTINGYELIDYSVKEFVDNHCDLDPTYRIDSVSLMNVYQTNTQDPIKVPAQFISQLEYLGFTNTKNTDGRYIVGLLPREGSLEQFIHTLDTCGHISLKDFMTAYNSYCDANSLRPYKQPTVKARLEYLGYTLQNYNNGCINILELSIKN